jgi:MYXO-CTERM domain-containing protein
MPPTTFVVPDDSLAAEYGFTAGLRSRILALVDAAPGKVLPYPTIYDAATGRIAGLDYSLLMDAQVTPPELLAILKYTLDLHLQGNRSPFVVLSHAFLYSFEGADNVDNTPTLQDQQARWAALTAFITYANSKPEVRMVPLKDVLAWMLSPAALGGDGGTPPADSGTGGSAGQGGTGGTAGTSGAAGSPAQPAESSSGCGCRVQGSDRAAPWGMLVALVAGLGLQRRRSRPRARRSLMESEKAV